MSELVLNTDQALQLLFKIMIPGTFCKNAKMCASSILSKIYKDKAINKYRTVINSLVPLFLLQSLAMEFNFKSFTDLLKKGEESEMLEDFLDSGIKKTPLEFKEDLNDEFLIRETIQSSVEGMPLLQDMLDFFKDLACLDFEIIL